MGILSRFRELKKLLLEAQTKNFQVVSSLTSLEELTLRSITLPDLSPLVPLRRLMSLAIKLGGTRDLGLLPQIGELRYLELWLVKGLSDISMVGQLPHLRYLFLQALKQVDRLPDLSQNLALRRVDLETMKGLHDLRPLTSAPVLEDLVLVDMPQLSVAEVEPLVGSRTLKRATIGLGSLKRNAAASALLGLPQVEGRPAWRGVGT